MSFKVLVVDDEEEIRASLTGILNTIGYPAASAADADGALKQAAEFRPDVVLLDIHLGGGVDGIEICRLIKADASAKNVHVMMLTASADRETVQRAMAAGAADYIVKPFKMSVLVQKLVGLAMVRQGIIPPPAQLSTSATGVPSAPPPVFRILVVDDDEEIRRTMTTLLSTMGYQIEAAENARQTFKMMREFNPHLILLDIALPHSLDGVEICRRLKETPQTSSARVIMMTAASDKATVQKATDAGACDYLVKPFKTPQLLRKLARHLLGQEVADPAAVGAEEEPGDEPVETVEQEPPPQKRRRGSGLVSARAAAEDEPDRGESAEGPAA